jgi:hypothetical protein
VAFCQEHGISPREAELICKIWLKQKQAERLRAERLQAEELISEQRYKELKRYLDYGANLPMCDMTAMQKFEEAHGLISYEPLEGSKLWKTKVKPLDDSLLSNPEAP